MERGLRPDLRFGKVKRKEISNCTLCKLLSEEVAPTVILTPVLIMGDEQAMLRVSQAF